MHEQYSMQCFFQIPNRRKWAENRRNLGALDFDPPLCYIRSMSDTLTVRVPVREKETWQKVAKAVGEDLSESPGKCWRKGVQAFQPKQGPPGDDLLGTESPDPPPATNQNVRKAMRLKPA